MSCCQWLEPTAASLPSCQAWSYGAGLLVLSSPDGAGDTTDVLALSSPAPARVTKTALRANIGSGNTWSSEAGAFLCNSSLMQDTKSSRPARGRKTLGARQAIVHSIMRKAVKYSGSTLGRHLRLIADMKSLLNFGFPRGFESCYNALASFLPLCH